MVLVLGLAAAGHPADGSSPAASDAGQEKEPARLLFPVVYSSTLTVFSIQSVTSTVPFTCFNSLTGTATACTGRRRRRRSGRLGRPRALEPPGLARREPGLQGSLAEDRISPTESESSRLVLTSWITVVSSVTSVSTVTKYDTTVSLGMLCTIGGASFFKTCP
ncbi:hypothetical protein FJT64_011407 [Amphibalanus amphitrite]|uniref:Uncharacterized protein n=1 Tax=Amphibalanus amphitrite TaxID=1232801 RepID=A0A6A4VFM2_AMPAM|nr:hypothetical protein FJT64_011407 [Amphibalanus amphitrite]